MQKCTLPAVVLSFFYSFVFFRQQKHRQKTSFIAMCLYIFRNKEVLLAEARHCSSLAMLMLRDRSNNVLCDLLLE